MKLTDINKLRRKLLEEVEDDLVKKMYVERYIDFLKIDSKCDTEIRKDGATIWIENASQRFAKPHPAVKTKLDIATKMERLEVLIGISPSENVLNNAPPSKQSVKKSGLI